MLFSLLGILVLFLIVGVFRPFKFIPSAKRWHYAVGAFSGIMLIGFLSPADPERTTLANVDSAGIAMSEPQVSYDAEDLYWDDDTRPYQEELLAISNRIVSENDQCDALNANGVTLSQNRGTPASPVYFVTCENSDGPPFNVWFERKDLEARETFGAIAHIDQGQALLRCQEAARAAATNPSTVDFSTFVDVGFQKFSNGRAILRSTFTAQNLLGAEAEYAIECPFDGGTMRDITISER